MNNQKIKIEEKNLLLDLGDTLVSINEPFHVHTRRGIEYVYDLLRLAVTRTEFINYFLNYRNKIRNKAHTTMIETPLTDVLTNILEHYNVNVSDELLDNLETEYIKAEIEVTSLFPDTITFLEKYKEDKAIVAVINNFSEKMVYSIISNLKIIDYFSSIYISGVIGLRKPHPEFLNTVCLSKNIQRADCIILGDKIEIDVRAGKNSGIKTCLIDRDGTRISRLTDETRPDYVIRNLSEI